MISSVRAELEALEKKYSLSQTGTIDERLVLLLSKMEELISTLLKREGNTGG